MQTPFFASQPFDDTDLMKIVKYSIETMVKFTENFQLLKKVSTNLGKTNESTNHIFSRFFGTLFMLLMCR